MKRPERSPASAVLLRNLVLAACVLVVIHIIGTFGFWHFAHGRAGLFDAFYMTFTTIATIGYAEFIDLSGNMPGRIFNVILATSGIATVWVMFSNFTALLLERSMDPARRRRKVLKEIAKLDRHYIICGVGRVGSNVARELHATDHRFVAIDEDQDAVDRLVGRMRDLGEDAHVLMADATSDDALIEAGIRRARGVFAVTGDDGRNMVIALAARQLNPHVRIVARVHDVRNVEKCRRAGADEIVSPDFTGGLRIASAMLRPHAMNFIDQMLRRSDGLRVDEVELPNEFAPRPLGEIAKPQRDALLVALHTGDDWHFNPSDDTVVGPGVALVIIATPSGRREFAAAVERLTRE